MKNLTISFPILGGKSIGDDVLGKYLASTPSPGRPGTSSGFHVARLHANQPVDALLVRWRSGPLLAVIRRRTTHLQRRRMRRVLPERSAVHPIPIARGANPRGSLGLGFVLSTISAVPVNEEHSPWRARR